MSEQQGERFDLTAQDPLWQDNFRTLEDMTHTAAEGMAPGYDLRMQVIDGFVASRGYRRDYVLPGYIDMDGFTQLVLDLGLEELAKRRDGEDVLVHPQATEGLKNVLNTVLDVNNIMSLHRFQEDAEGGEPVTSTLLAKNPAIIFSTWMLGFEIRTRYQQNLIAETHQGVYIKALDEMVAGNYFDNKEYDFAATELERYKSASGMYKLLLNGRNKAPASIEELVGTMARTLEAFVVR